MDYCTLTFLPFISLRSQEIYNLTNYKRTNTSNYNRHLIISWILRSMPEVEEFILTYLSSYSWGITFKHTLATIFYVHKHLSPKRRYLAVTKKWQSSKIHTQFKRRAFRFDPIMFAKWEAPRDFTSIIIFRLVPSLLLYLDLFHIIPFHRFFFDL